MSIILVNDYLYGLLGEEKVLWNYLLEQIPNLKGVDITIMKNNNQYNDNISFEQNVSNYIYNNYIDCKLIIQNGSWFNLIPYDVKKIILIQDNLRKMGYNNTIQEENFKNADFVITNSDEVDKYYFERNCFQIPLGVDNEIFNIITNDKNTLRKEMNLPINIYNKFGIFVGSFTETKGWSIMVDIINRRKDIFWILITKHENENFYSDNSIVYQKINQNLLVKLLNCADFFILPSPSETQCLAAIEANLCNIPTIMRNTGYFSNFKENESVNIGIITNLFLNEDIDNIYKNNFNPRDIVIKKYSILKMIDEWNYILNIILNTINKNKLNDIEILNELKYSCYSGNKVRASWISNYKTETDIFEFKNYAKWSLQHWNMYKGFLTNIKKKDNLFILDAGCGVGYNTKMLQEYLPNSKIIGIDLNEQSINMANKYNYSENIKYIVGDLLITSSDIKFDYIFFLEVLDHIKSSDHYIIINKLLGLLKEEGLLFISTRNELDNSDSIIEHIELLNRERANNFIKKYKNNIFNSQFYNNLMLDTNNFIIDEPIETFEYTSSGIGGIQSAPNKSHFKIILKK